MAEEEKTSLKKSFFLETYTIYDTLDPVLPTALIKKVSQYYLHLDEFQEYLKAVLEKEELLLKSNINQAFTSGELNNVIAELQKEIDLTEDTLGVHKYCTSFCSLICLAGVTPALAVGFSQHNDVAQAAGLILFVIGYIICFPTFLSFFRAGDLISKINTLINDIENYKFFDKDRDFSSELKAIQIIKDNDDENLEEQDGEKADFQALSSTPYVALDDEESQNETNFSVLNR